MTAEDRVELGQALVLWRYVGYKLKAELIPDRQSEARRKRVLGLAAKVGVKAEYIRALLATPVMSVRVDEFE